MIYILSRIGFETMKKNISRHVLVTITMLLMVCTSYSVAGADCTCEDNQQYSVVDSQTAFLVAQTMLQNIQKTTYTISASQDIKSDQGLLLCHVFSLQPTGYIVVSALYDLPPILAYSFTSTFSGAGNLLQGLIKTDLQQRVQHASAIPSQVKEENNRLWMSFITSEIFKEEDTTFYQWPYQGTTRSGGWLETQWDQYSPYNDFCPIDMQSGERSVAGCPAVTMAQICHYHQTTNNVQLNDSDDYYHDYAGNSYWIDDDYETYDFIPFPELNSHLDSLMLQYKNQLPITDQQKAALTFACGIAAEQVYHPNGSGTFGVGQAYQAYERFAFEGIALLDDDDPDVYERVQENIKDGFPVHLAVVNEEWTSGHNLVIDGYNTYGYYHLNFGWGGPYDGWYQFPEELPFDLTFLEGVIVDITNDNDDSDLQGEGVLYWSDVQPLSTVEESFTITNVGDEGSEIDWEVITWPSWGDWSFDPDAGEDLTAGNGPLTINVSVKVPFGRNKHYTGYIKVGDVNNQTNSCLIHVSLTTPHLLWRFHLLQLFLQTHPNAFPILRQLLDL